MRNSRNAYRYAGQKEIVDAKTGEVEKAVLVKSKRQDVNFVKIFLPEKGYRMFPSEMTVSARELFEYLWVVAGRDNVAIAPTAEIEERIGMSASSISRGKSQLLKLDFIRQRSHGIYMLNPSKVCKADGEKRAEAYEVYSLLPCGTE